VEYFDLKEYELVFFMYDYYLYGRTTRRERNLTQWKSSQECLLNRLFSFLYIYLVFILHPSVLLSSVPYFDFYIPFTSSFFQKYRRLPFCLQRYNTGSIWNAIFVAALSIRDVLLLWEA